MIGLHRRYIETGSASKGRADRSAESWLPMALGDETDPLYYVLTLNAYQMCMLFVGAKSFRITESLTAGEWVIDRFDPDVIGPFGGVPFDVFASPLSPVKAPLWPYVYLAPGDPATPASVSDFRIGFPTVHRNGAAYGVPVQLSGGAGTLSYDLDSANPQVGTLDILGATTPIYGVGAGSIDITVRVEDQW